MNVKEDEKKKEIVTYSSIVKASLKKEELVKKAEKKEEPVKKEVKKEVPKKEVKKEEPKKEVPKKEVKKEEPKKEIPKKKRSSTRTSSRNRYHTQKQSVSRSVRNGQSKSTVLRCMRKRLC